MSVDIVSLLAEGDKRIVGNVDKVVKRALQNPGAINGLVQCLEEGDEALAMRATDALEKIHAKKPKLISPYTSRLFQVFATRDQKEIRWHMAQIIPRLSLTPGQLKKAAEIWQRDFYHFKSSIVKILSLQAMYDISRHNPSFEDDFAKMLGHAHANVTPAMKTRARKLANA